MDIKGQNNSFVGLIEDIMVRLNEETQNMIALLPGIRKGVQNIRFHFADKTKKVYTVLDGKFLIKTRRTESFNEKEVVKVESVK